MPSDLYVDRNEKRWTRDELEKGDWGLPLPIVRALVGREHVSTSDVSVTELAGDAPQQAILGRRHGRVIDPWQLWSASLGTAFHDWIQAGCDGYDNALVETPTRQKVDGILVGGRLDYATVVVGGRGWFVDTLREWKSVELKHVFDMKRGRKAKWHVLTQEGIEANRKSWLTQLALVKALLFMDGRDTKSAEVTVYIRDWRTDEAKLYPFTYPQRITTVPVELPPAEECVKELKMRVAQWKKAIELVDRELATFFPCNTWRGLRCRDWCGVRERCYQYGNDQKANES